VILENKPFGCTWEWLKGPHQIEGHMAAKDSESMKKMKTSFGISTYLEDIKNNNVVKSVHVQAECSNAKGETEWLQSIADAKGFPHGIVAYANFADDDVDQLLEFHSKFKNVRGIRKLLNWDDEKASLRVPEKDYLKDPKWRKGFALLAKYNMSYDLQIWYTQMDDAFELAKEYPNIQIILNHTGLPMGFLDPSENAIQGWQNGMKKLAQCPNVVVKISGLCMTYHDVNLKNFKPLIDFTISCFGVERCMFASNFPVDRLNTTYDNLFVVFKECVKDLPADHQKKLFHDNAIKYYRL